MPHLKQGRKLSRRKGTREALLKNLAFCLLRDGKLTTTEAKAKEVVPLVENLITTGLQDNLKGRRKILKVISHPALVEKIMTHYKEKYQKRQGGYLRIYKLKKRPGDAAPMVKIEFI